MQENEQKTKEEWDKFYAWYQQNASNILWRIVIIGIFIASLIDVIAAHTK